MSFFNVKLGNKPPPKVCLCKQAPRIRGFTVCDVSFHKFCYYGKMKQNLRAKAHLLIVIHFRQMMLVVIATIRMYHMIDVKHIHLGLHGKTAPPHKHLTKRKLKIIFNNGRKVCDRADIQILKKCVWLSQIA